ncbi:hypothetical protein [Nonomuraea typhae]|uniref:hypothetical protein n=1 Tax=Nonomuraea typhae TaxID=2603600 RepID=UPI0012F8313A|nr:hypothetical protein [Nonomuraea typhae]
MRWARIPATIALLSIPVTACADASTGSTEVAVTGDCNAIANSTTNCTIYTPPPPPPAYTPPPPTPEKSACQRATNILNRIAIAPTDREGVSDFYRELARDLLAESDDAPAPLAETLRDFAGNYADLADAYREGWDAIEEIEAYTKLGRPLTPYEDQAVQTLREKAQAAQDRAKSIGERVSGNFDDLTSDCG